MTATIFPTILEMSYILIPGMWFSCYQVQDVLFLPKIRFVEHLFYLEWEKRKNTLILCRLYKMLYTSFLDIWKKKERTRFQFLEISNDANWWKEKQFYWFLSKRARQPHTVRSYSNDCCVSNITTPVQVDIRQLRAVLCYSNDFVVRNVLPIKT